MQLTEGGRRVPLVGSVQPGTSLGEPPAERVRPGVLEMRTIFCVFSTICRSELLPTFERPMNANSGRPVSGKISKLGAEAT